METIKISSWAKHIQIKSICDTMLRQHYCNNHLLNYFVAEGYSKDKQGIYVIATQKITLEHKSSKYL